jgi:NTE family protein
MNAVTKTAFVLSGGASLGAVQVGMLMALAERGHEPDLLVGTSVGAVNAAYIAQHGTGRESLEALARIWRGLRRDEVFHLGLRQQLLAVSGRRASLFSPQGLEQALRRHLPYARLEDAPIPVHLVATDIQSGEEVLLSSGDAVSAVLASAAIPGLYPVVERNGRALADGGLADNAAISQAVGLGVERIFVLPTGFACALEEVPRTAIASALQAVSLLTQQRLVRDVAVYADQVELHVLPPLCPLTVSPADFTHAAELIDRAHRTALEWLDTGSEGLQHPERLHHLHFHRRSR